METEAQLRHQLAEILLRAKNEHRRHRRRKMRLLAKQVEAAMTIVRFSITEEYILKDLKKQETSISNINENFQQWKKHNPQEHNCGNLRTRYNKLMGVKQMIWKVEVIHIILFGTKKEETNG